MILGARIAALGVAAAALAFGIASTGGSVIAIGVVIPLLLWALYYFRNWEWASGATFVTFIALVAIGTMRGETSPLLMLIAILAAIVLWDLDSFNTRIGRIPDIVDEAMLIRGHMTRLGVLLVASAILYAISGALEIDLGVGSALVLSLLVFFGLRLAIGYVRRESD